MPKAGTVQKFRDEPKDADARIVTAIATAGPRNIAQISRMTGIHQETVRYKVKNRFAKLGFRFHAEVDFAKIGLNLHWATLRFTRPYQGRAKELLRALHKVGYLIYFAKIVPQGHFVALFALPEGSTGAYEEFLAGLREGGILNSFTFDEVSLSSHRRMDPKYFNFRTGRWEIEWESIRASKPTPLPSEKKTPVDDFDYQDLLIIKELQKDARMHVTEIARVLKQQPKTLEYHYRNHVVKQKLVSSYRVRWTQDIGKSLEHSVALMRATFTGLTRKEFADIQAAVSKIPFLWAEDVLASGTFIATLYVPVKEMIAVTNFISEAAPDQGKMEIGFVEPSEVGFFTIPYNMYSKGGWKFDAKQIESALKSESNVPAQK